MREISSYCLKVVQVERILSDLEIVSNMDLKINGKESFDIINALKIKQNSNFIKNKQIEFNLILNKQEKYIEQLRNFIHILERKTFKDK